MGWLVLILLAAAAVAPFVAERRRPDMDDDVRALAPGRFAALSDGQTHYQWQGPADGPVLVCVHGLTTPAYVWDRLAPALAEAGFRVLTYDLFGRGYSDRPRGRQTRSFFIRQLRELLQHEGVGGPVSVIGYSMGGSIATIFAAEEPDRVDRLILLAPAGMIHAPGRLAAIARRLPVVGDWLMLTFGGAQLRGVARELARAAPDLAGVAERQGAETAWRGYLPAVLSSQRNLLAETLEEEHRAIAASGLPVLAIWGREDKVIPITAMGRLTEWNRDVRHGVIEGAGHALGLTHATEVIEELARLLAE